MADYGHDLRFGTFITPQAQNPETPVLLAQVADRAGLDLVTFQDHPYQPAFLETWTLLTWVAAQTERIHLSGNVLNLALRPPAVLAKSAATLDLLSGGRFELGIGAGGFWDAIAAYGGPRRTPGESVEALDEALDVIRGIWDTSTRRGVTASGKHYSVRGAKRGPEPAHDIPIWIGAVKPRMQRLIGRKGDGWLPSLAYLKEGDLDRGNATIDEAAAKAGRDPREIRRLLNIGTPEGPPSTWIDELLPYALEQGISTFILMSDDPETISRYGGEVAPALRGAVAEARERRGTASGGVIRGARALAQRTAGIDYDALPNALRAKAIEPGDKAYPRVRSTYVRTGAPGLVIAAESADDVAAALTFAREQDVALAVRSGGHGISGRSTNDGGIVIDVGKLDRVELLDTGRVRVGPGARWGHVARALAPHGLAISSGDSGDVGVGGLATAGGIGFLGRRYGLTIDHVAAADIVLADGSLVRADADLLWATRGAGGNFGIVTAFELDAYPVDNVIYAYMVFDGRDSAAAIERWGALVEAAPRELTSFLYLQGGGRDTPIIRVTNVWAADQADAAIDVLTPMLEIAPLLDQQAARTPYSGIVPASDATHHGRHALPLISNGFANHLTDEIAATIAAGVTGDVAPWVAIRAVGGAVNDTAPDATSYAHRHQSFNVNSANYRSAERDFRGYWDELRPLLDGLYLSFETDDRPERLTDAFPAGTLTRLRELKTKYDPDNVFNQNFPIAPLGQTQIAA